MALIRIETPYSETELTQLLNGNFTELDREKAAKTDLNLYVLASEKGAANGVATLDETGTVDQIAAKALEADNYNPNNGTISLKFEELAALIQNIVTGNTTVGKAAALNPASAPGNSKFYGTSPSGVIGFYDQIQPEEAPEPLIREPFTADDTRWSAAVDGIYTLTVPRNGLDPTGVLMLDGNVNKQVRVGMQTDDSSVYVRAHSKFGGYVVIG